MKSIKKAALGLLLATTAFAASAAKFDGYDFVPPNFDAGTRQTFNFTVGDSTVKAGDTFSYDLYFNTPPLAPSTYFAFNVFGNNASFDGASFLAAGDPATMPPNYFFSATSSVVQGAGFLDSGTYDLYLSGTFLADGAMVAGFVADDINATYVPEPMSLSLVGLGLAGMAGLRRRKAGKAAA